jgi:hypothetical protein
LNKTKWEYVKVSDYQELHLLGAEGWELVSVTGAVQGDTAEGKGDTFYLKRPYPSIREQITAEQRERVLTEGKGNV